MIIDQPGHFADLWDPAPIPTNYARLLFLRRPDGFRYAADSANDNVYMDSGRFDSERACAQWEGLVTALRAAGQLVLALPGDPQTPEAVFPNNVFATAPGRLLIGAMCHNSRQYEALHAPTRNVLGKLLGLQTVDLSQKPVVAELTGSLVIDRARSLGYCGLSERCNRAGAEAMHEGFALKHSVLFDLSEGEYHSNVVLSALGGRGLLGYAGGIADEQWFAVWRQAMGERLIEISLEEKNAFVANCIALGGDQLWMSAAAVAALRPATRAAIEALGLSLHSSPLDEIEKAGGSLRCMIGEVY